MAVWKINESTLTDIADAIRSKTGSSALINPEDMASEIESIPTSGWDLVFQPTQEIGRASAGGFSALWSYVSSLLENNGIATNKQIFIAKIDGAPTTYGLYCVDGIDKNHMPINVFRYDSGLNIVEQNISSAPSEWSVVLSTSCRYGIKVGV